MDKPCKQFKKQMAGMRMQTIVQNSKNVIEWVLFIFIKKICISNKHFLKFFCNKGKMGTVQFLLFVASDTPIL